MKETSQSIVEELRLLHPADIADHLQRLEPVDAAEALRQLPPKLAAATLGELDADRAEELMTLVPTERLGALIEDLPHPEAVDLLGEMPIARRETVLVALRSETSEAIRALLRYPEDTAGGIMSDRFITLRPEQSLAQVLERLRSRTDGPSDEVGYLYVTDARRRLVGIVSLRDLVFRNPQRQVAEVMNDKVTSVRVDTDQEELARQFDHYHYVGLPVVDDRQRLVGVVKSSDILRVATAEATEDMQLMVGLSGEERALTPWHRSLGGRLSWLYVNLGTAFLAAIVVSLFENTIARWTALAVFLPIVAGQGGNAGMQTLTVIIRDMALGELSRGDGWRALRKEIILGLINGLAIGAVVGVIAWLWKDSPELGIVTASAMILNQLAAGLSGVLIPFGLKKLKLDPALASSIFLTTVTDVAGFFFFLALATLIMHGMGMV